jgi:hypothetical protein
LKDLENNTLSAQRQTALLQQARVDWLADNWLIGVEAQQFQGIAEDLTDNYQRLPQVSAVWRGDKTLSGLAPIVNIQAANFDTDFEKVRGQRLFHEVGVSLPLSRSYGFLNSQLTHRGIQYSLKDPGMLRIQEMSVLSHGWPVLTVDSPLSAPANSLVTRSRKRWNPELIICMQVTTTMWAFPILIAPSSRLAIDNCSEIRAFQAMIDWPMRTNSHWGSLHV